MQTTELAFEPHPTPEQVQYLEDPLYEFNSSVTGTADVAG